MSTRWFLAAASALAIAVSGAASRQQAGPRRATANVLDARRDRDIGARWVGSLRSGAEPPPPFLRAASGRAAASMPHGTTVYIDARRVGGTRRSTA